jgi:hypothetical protein
MGMRALPVSERMQLGETAENQRERSAREQKRFCGSASLLDKRGYDPLAAGKDVRR